MLKVDTSLYISFYSLPSNNAIKCSRWLVNNNKKGVLVHWFFFFFNTSRRQWMKMVSYHLSWKFSVLLLEKSLFQNKNKSQDNWELYARDTCMHKYINTKEMDQKMWIAINWYEVLHILEVVNWKQQHIYLHI